MRARNACAALLVISLPAAAGAQSVSLTESEFLSQVTGDTPRTQAIRSTVDVARADALSAAARWPNPRVSWNREAVAGVTEHMVTVGQALPVTGRRGLDMKAASALVDAAERRAAEDVRQLRAEARRAFASLLTAQERERELSMAAGKLRDLATLIGRREAAGESAGFDRIRVEHALLDIETEDALTTAEIARARAALSAFVVTPLSPQVVAAADRAPTRPVPSLEELMATAEQSRGDFRALQEDARAAEFALDSAKRRRVPEPEVVAGTKSSSALGGDIGSVVSVHASIPLFDRSNPERASATARASQATTRQSALRMSMRAEIAATRETLLERRALAEQYRMAMPERTNPIERIAQVTYEAGERGLLDVLDAYRTTAAARLRQLELDALVREAEIDLELVSGWGLP